MDVKAQTLEKFKSQLVHDVFGEEADSNAPVQMEKVTMLLWYFRDDPRVIQFLSQFLTKFSSSRQVFDGIEFYLPQLAHMIIHLEADWDDEVLERFALVISQHSLHFALQFNWILQGATEDYQPETLSGEPNPQFNALYYSRCVKLLTNMERCVVYGSQRGHELQKLFESGSISKEEFNQMQLADRKFNAAQILNSCGEGRDYGLGLLGKEISLLDKHPCGGWLLYKRNNRRAAYKRKTWKRRYFVASDRMFYCYVNQPHQGHSTLRRAMPLEGAKIVPVLTGKYPHMFEVHNQSWEFRVRADSKEDLDRWINLLRDEAESKGLFSNHPLPPVLAEDGIETDVNGEAKESVNKSGILSHLTTEQRARYVFFKGERDFVRGLCDTAEKLRFRERDDRKSLAPLFIRELTIPPSAYIPMCNSTDVWRRVSHSFPEETKVFNTKERCPLFMYFAVKGGENANVNMDVAGYLQRIYEKNRSIDLRDSSLEALTEESDGRSDDIESVWTDTNERDGDLEVVAGKGNIRLKRFMKDMNLRALPKSIARRLPSKRNSARTLLPLQSVRILDTKSIDEEFDAVSVAEAHEPIDEACLNRVKAFVCGGEMWVEKRDRLLKEEECMANAKDRGVVEILPIIAKSNDDVRQEVFVMQMIHYYQSVFLNAGLPIWLKTYRILSCSKDTGLIEALLDATSIDGLKKSDGYPKTGGLLAYFKLVYGPVGSPLFNAAQYHFMTSLVGYSLVSYLLGLKDRHNGNIMITVQGHLIFIDFGFAMGMAPGHEFSLEQAPFKLTAEYMELMGGEKGECFAEFKRLFVAGFEAARSHSQIAMGLVEIMMYKSNYPCFSGSRYGYGIALKRFENRLMLSVPDNQVKRKAEKLVLHSVCHTGTLLYDKFQLSTNGILP
mmetsp:Transcript_21145/g.24340  ORF Transcript_21145/g.24340 Transcript_21145/m.24340 type:complete len:896 (-) Transcript_21145:582-3269(-)